MGSSSSALLTVSALRLQGRSPPPGPCVCFFLTPSSRPAGSRGSGAEAPRGSRCAGHPATQRSQAAHCSAVRSCLPSEQRRKPRLQEVEGPRSHSWGVTELGFELMLPWLSRCHTWHLIWVLNAGLSPGDDGGSCREVGAWAGPGPWTKSDGNNGSSGGWVALGRVGAGARGCGERWWADPGDSAPPVPSSSFWVRMGVTLGISAPTPR